MAPTEREEPKDTKMPEESKSREPEVASGDPRKEALKRMEVNLSKRETEAKLRAAPERPLNVAMEEASKVKERNK